MRLGADAGRNFLSTKDPISKDAKILNVEAEVVEKNDAAVQRPGVLQRLLRQLYSGGANFQ